MSNQVIEGGLDKVEAAIPNLRAFKRASGLGVTLPVGDTLDTYLPTMIYIATVSILADALEAFVKANHPNPEADTLGLRINHLTKLGVLDNPNRLKQIKDDRNRYAHDQGQYASWGDLDPLLADIRAELAHLGIPNLAP